MSWNSNGFLNTFTMVLSMVFITFKNVDFCEKGGCQAIGVVQYAQSPPYANLLLQVAKFLSSPTTACGVDGKKRFKNLTKKVSIW